MIVRFAGDSGDGMQLAGSRFTEATAEHGNDFATLPSFPAEIRAPAGTLAGVSAFQIHFAAQDILTPGDEPDVLVAMNPAALRSELPALARSGTVIANEDAFSKRNLQKAGYETNPLEDGSLDGYHLIRIPMTSLTAARSRRWRAVSTRDAGRAKNLFALGVVSWLYDRPTAPTEDWLRRKFVNKPGPLEANLAAFRAGWNFGETSELIDVQYRVDPATDVPPGTYRNVNGTTATALGLIAASVRSGLPLVLASYPITPASELLHELARHQDMGVRTIQAEDEIAAAGMALGAAFGGALGVTATSGPGMDLKAETIGLAADARAAAGRHRRPARRAVDRHADQDRAVGPADGDPRPPRRVAAAGGRRLDAGPVLRRRLRGRADRGPLPHARDPAVRPLPRQLERAVADPGYRRAAADRPRLRRGRRRGVPAVRARREGRPAVGDPRHARASRTGSAGWRSRTSAATSPTTASTTRG